LKFKPYNILCIDQTCKDFIQASKIPSEYCSCTVADAVTLGLSHSSPMKDLDSTLTVTISFHKKCAGTHYAELVFLHLVGSVGHVVS
jgi:hypothetical protein